MDIGDKIRKVRELKGFKQEYVATELGMSVTAYGNIERNASGITFERLEEIARVLEVTVQDIVSIPEQVNVSSIANSHQVGVGFHHIYHDNRTGEGEIEAFKRAIGNLEKEVEYLRSQNSQLLSLLGKKA